MFVLVCVIFPSLQRHVFRIEGCEKQLFLSIVVTHGIAWNEGMAMN
jgi:hypothetical protein